MELRITSGQKRLCIFHTSDFMSVERCSVRMLAASRRRLFHLCTISSHGGAFVARTDQTRVTALKNMQLRTRLVFSEIRMLSTTGCGSI